MPYKSLAQERWAHTPEGRKALGAKLAEFDAASKGMKLPARVKKPSGGILGNAVKKRRKVSYK